MALVPFDTNDELQHPGTPDGEWEYKLPNGDYPVVVVMGDAAHRDSTNTVSVGGVICVDPDPYDPAAPAGYEQGDFDGYAVIAHVKNNKLQITTAPGAVNAKICFVEIGPLGGTIDAAMRTRLADLVRRMTEATAGTPPALATASHVYGSYVDDAVMTVDHGVRRYLHANVECSVAAVTDGGGAVIERYGYDAYGTRSVTTASFAPLSATAIGNQVGLTGRYLDQETGDYQFRARCFSPRLGRFLSRDAMRRTWRRPSGGDGYQDGMGLYAAYFVPNGIDPWGLEDFPVDCGTVAIAITAGHIAWSFHRDPAKTCCCDSTGWIQHTQRNGFDPPWGYDNGAYKRGPNDEGGGLGAPSDPRLPNQPVTRPPGASGTGQDRWRSNPWYPASGDDPADPQPRDSASDTPTEPAPGNTDVYILQLVCQDTGKVLFTYTWSNHRPGDEHPTEITGHQGLDP